tara:strand:+ start:75 stop:257 length:183 start_codon:yes stop_codon:yes gene_type:complete
MAVSVTDEWVNSTRSFGSFIRGRPCLAPADVVGARPTTLRWLEYWAGKARFADLVARAGT